MGFGRIFGFTERARGSGYIPTTAASTRLLSAAASSSVPEDSKAAA
jgi:hypothetical protein